MGRKNSKAQEVSRKTPKPNQIRREAEKARHLLSNAYKPYSTPQDFTFTVSTVVSPEVLAELQAVYGK